jgi:hypothetical protein
MQTAEASPAVVAERKNVGPHTVAARFSQLQLRKLDALVAREEKENGTWPRVTRSSVLLALVEQEAAGLKLGPAERDERQRELFAAEHEGPISVAVAKLERSARALEAKAKAKAKKNRPTKKKATKRPAKKNARKGARK